MDSYQASNISFQVEGAGEWNEEIIKFYFNICTFSMIVIYYTNFALFEQTFDIKFT